MKHPPKKRNAIILKWSLYLPDPGILFSMSMCFMCFKEATRPLCIIFYKGSFPRWVKKEAPSTLVGKGPQCFPVIVRVAFIMRRASFVLNKDSKSSAKSLFDFRKIGDCQSGFSRETELAGCILKELYSEELAHMVINHHKWLKKVPTWALAFSITVWGAPWGTPACSRYHPSAKRVLCVSAPSIRLLVLD